MAVTTGNFKVEPMDVTFNSVNLGPTRGGVEISFSHEGQPIVCDQYGGVALGEVQTSVSVEVSMTLPEMTAATWDDVFGSVGGNLTPPAGTLVSGMGTSKLFTDVFSSGALLKLKPTGAANDLRNLHFHKAIPVPGSISFGGEDFAEMSITFRCVPDLTLDSAINLFVFGDGTQTLT